MLKQINDVIINTDNIQSIEFKDFGKSQYIDFTLDKGILSFELKKKIKTSKESEISKFMKKINKKLHADNLKILKIK